MNILAIETSCDDTALSIVRCEGDLNNPSFEVLENIVSSQVNVHRPFGGVVPHLAKREHVKNLPLLAEQIRSHGHSIDAVAVTVGPGLSPALWAGITFAQELATELGVDLLGANHLEGHMYSILLPKKEESANFDFNDMFPSIGLIVSGGHTILLRMDSLSSWEKLGETRDDAVGEAFDKVAKMVGLPYPGGPEIDKIAAEYTGEYVDFPRPLLDKPGFDFSFSGLKTAVLYHLEKETGDTREKVVSSFQRAAIDVLKKKTARALESCDAKSLFVCGGVAANTALKTSLASLAQEFGISFFTPSDFVYNTDNAAMIAVAAYIAQLRGVTYEFEAKPNLNIGSLNS